LYATEVFGGMGTLATPMNNIRGRYLFGIVTEPRGLAQPFLIVTNGKLAFEDVAQARYTGLIGKAVVPAYARPSIWSDTGGARVPDHISTFMTKVDRFLEEKGKDQNDNIHYYLNLSIPQADITGMDKSRIEIKHLLTKVWPKLKAEGFVTWSDNQHRYLAIEESSFGRAIDNIQYYITMFLQPLIHGGFEVDAYGLGTITPGEDGLEVHQYPSILTNFAPSNEAIMKFTSDSRTNTERGYTFMYTYLLAAQIRKMFIKFGILKGEKTLDTGDYMAYASEIIANKSGYGENSMNVMYSGLDIVGQVRDEIGNGIALAYPWQDFDDDLFEELLEFWIIKAIVCARIKAYTMQTQVSLTKGDRIRAAFDFQQESNAELPGIGGEGQPYMWMACNYPEDKLFFPMRLRGENPQWHNDYKRRMHRTLTVSKVNVKNSEIQGTPLDPLQLKESFVQWVVENDARRWDITYPWYKLMIWRFPLHTWTKIEKGTSGADLNASRYQAMLYFLSQMAQGAGAYSDGWFIHDNIHLYGAVATVNIAGLPNPIDMGLADTAEKAKEIASRTVPDKTDATARPERISQTETSPLAKSPPPAEETRAPPGESKAANESNVQQTPASGSGSLPKDAVPNSQKVLPTA